MGYCDSCLSAGSVNTYGYCEICGTEHERDIVAMATIIDSKAAFESNALADIARAS